MVAISLYRGNLHRVSDVPRQWLMPTPKISLKDFKILLHRRSKALSRLHSAATTSNPNPHIKQEQDQEPTQHPTYEDESNIDPNHKLQLEPPAEAEESEESVEGAPKDQIESEDGEIPVKPIGGLDILVDDKTVVPEINSNLAEQLANSLDEITAVPLNPSSETNNKKVALNDKEERKREVEEKLKILNARKHNLVQVLKQILNAEEELKKRSSMQGLAVRPSISLQVDVSNDSGSMTRHLSPRDGNPGGDVEGGEADDASNQNMHSHHMLRMSSMSPSSDSPHRRPSHSVVPHTSRATLGASASPSRFAPTGQQGHPASLPTVSVSGTNYIASSPSPVVSSGTSVFRDGRRPSPWN